MTTLFGWGRAFGTPCLSPYVAKADIQLQMFDIPFERAIANLDTVAKHKAPYVEDAGAIIEDSSFIRWHFEKKLGVDLDDGLDATQRATAWAFERLLEERMVPIMALERWVEADNFERGPIMFFAGAPEAVRDTVIADARARVRDALYAQGIGRHSREERMIMAEKDVAAVAALLDDKRFMMGDYPTALDGAAFGTISAYSAPVFETRLKDIVAAHANLVRYLERMERDFFPVDRWPAMGPQQAEAEPA